MSEPIPETHYATATASDPPRHLDSCTGLLGMHPGEGTVDLDDPETCHRDPVEKALLELPTGGWF